MTLNYRSEGCKVPKPNGEVGSLKTGCEISLPLDRNLAADPLIRVCQKKHSTTLQVKDGNIQYVRSSF